MVLPSDVTTRTSVGDGRSDSKATVDVVISPNKSLPETESCYSLFSRYISITAIDLANPFC
jgi:hypothetical protein